MPNICRHSTEIATALERARQLRADARPEHTFRVEARDEQFLRRGDQVFRRNQIWRRVIERRTGEQVGEELLKANCALVVYEPGPDVEVIAVG